MATQNKLNQSRLTFDNYLGKPNDLRISKALTTSEGDKIRVVATDTRTVMLARVGRSRTDDLDMIVTVVTDDVVMNFDLEDAKQAWELAKKIGSAVWDAVGGLIGGGDDGGGGGGGGNCPPPVTVTFPQQMQNSSIGNVTICVTNCGNTTRPQ
jgi:hypothetical protein